MVLNGKVFSIGCNGIKSKLPSAKFGKATTCIIAIYNGWLFDVSGWLFGRSAIMAVLLR